MGVLKKRSTQIILGLIALSFVVAAVLVLQFGPGGYFYEKMALRGMPEVLLKKYQKEQAQYFSENKKFRSDLHRQQWYGIDGIILGFADELPLVKRSCPDCLFAADHYKIAAYLAGDRTSFYWTIDDAGKFSSGDSR